MPLHYNFIYKLIDSGIKHVSVIGIMYETKFFEGNINEHTPANPQSLYGISKNALCRATKLKWWCYLPKAYIFILLKIMLMKVLFYPKLL